MSSKFVLTLGLVFALMGVLGLAFRVQRVEASGPIYIRADGSIDPPDAPISTLDNVTYTVTGNITSDADGILVERNSIIIDGAGYTVQGTGSGTGIYLSGRSNVTIKNTNTKRFSNGIVLQGSNNNSVSRNNITEIYWIGIYISLLSSNNIVSGNNVANNGYGISLSSSSNNIVSKNTVTNNGLYGITLSDDISVNNTISENTMTNNNYNIYFVGGFDNTISRNNIANNTYGIFLHSSNNTISENTITNNEHGIWLNYPSNNRFYHNNLIDNTIQVVPHLVSIWDDGYPSGGNYWSDYDGTDANHDGIGDTEYSIDINNIDHYPLMGMFSSYNTSYGYAVDFVSSSSISDVSFDLSYTEAYPELAMLAFKVSGEIGTDGFLRVCIPKILINGSYLIMFDSLIITDTTYPQVRELPCSNETYEYLYINYTHSEHTILITGTTTIPEFPSFLILPLFMTLTLLTIIICKRRHTRKSCSTSL